MKKTWRSDGADGVDGFGAAACLLVDRGVIEPTRPHVGREIDVLVQAECHGYPAVFRRQNAYSASYIGNSHSSF
jgi:hypothetical protein